MAIPLIPIVYGIITLATAYGIFQLKWIVHDITEAVDETSEGWNVFLISAGLLLAVFALAKGVKVFKK